MLVPLRGSFSGVPPNNAYEGRRMEAAYHNKVYEYLVLWARPLQRKCCSGILRYENLILTLNLVTIFGHWKTIGYTYLSKNRTTIIEDAFDDSCESFQTKALKVGDWPFLLLATELFSNNFARTIHFHAFVFPQYRFYHKKSVFEQEYGEI